MSFEKYGNKLINLLSKIENKLNPNAQIGGGDGPDADPNNPDGGPYVKILSYSVNHVSVLVHIEKNGTIEELENPQISYGEIKEYSIEQQLRLGCDNKGNMYNYSVVLTRRPKKESKFPTTLKKICQTPLYGLKAPDNAVQTECKVNNYSNDHSNSIKAIKQSKNIEDTTFVEEVADRTSEVINKQNIDKGKYIAVLGPVEDILGFFIKYVSEDYKDKAFKKFIVLSVNDKTWTTDFNYDFINCSINTGDDNNFNQLNPELPIILLNVGDNSILEGRNSEKLLTKLPRVTHCEIEWIRQKIEDKSYEWNTKDIKVDEKKVWIHSLKKKTGDAGTALGELSGLKDVAEAAAAAAATS